MFCIKCGTQNSEGSKFCANCGVALIGENNSRGENTSTSNIGDLHEMKDSNCASIHCPRCKSRKIQALAVSDIHGGYRVGRGCLGWLLLGPLGLLCGAFGKKSRISITNNTSFVCMECGFRFMHIEDMIAEKERKMKCYLIIGIIIFLFSVMALLDSPAWEGLCSFLIPLAFLGWYVKEKEARDDLEENGYDSEYYTKKVQE